jgi:replicative DNA helicase Mcm
MSADAIYNELGDELTEWLERECNQELSKLCEGYPDDKRTVYVDWGDLWMHNMDVAEDAREATTTVKEALRRCVVDATPGQSLIDARDAGPQNDRVVRGQKVQIKFTNVGDPKTVTELIRGDQIGELVTLRGKCTKASDTRPKPTDAALRCDNCGIITEMHQPIHGHATPNQCQSCESTRTTWTPELSQSDWSYHQLVRIKHEPGESESDSYIDVHILGEQAGALNGGESVDITGELKDIWPDGIESDTPEFILVADHVRKHESDFESIDVGDHAERVRELASGEDGSPYQLLIDSIAPTIYGEEMMDRIKLACALQLFGAPRVENDDGTAFRGDIHQLLVGAPGTGKSSILDAVANYSPKVARISGKNASKAGVTAAAVRDDFGDTEWSIEAGAFVQANKGICIVDELDKVNPEVLSSLHSALERQQLSIAKAGINAELQCQTALAGAANPEHERFVGEERTVEQIPVGTAMRNRLDAVFVLRDTVDEDLDREKVTTMVNGIASSDSIQTENFDDRDEITTPLTAEEIRVWVAYARQHHEVTFDMDVLRERITDYYLSLRQQSEASGAPVGLRKVGSILRYAIASARIRLGERVTDEDIERAKDIVGASLAQIGLTDEGELSVDAEVANTVAQADRIASVKDALRNADEPLTPAQVGERLGIDEDKAEQQLESLARDGRAMCPQTGVYRLV